MSEKIQYLALEDILEIGEALVPDFRIRDIGLIESAVNRPATTICGQEAYESLSDKIAALMHSIAPNRALIDGNKQLSWLCGKVFATLNEHDFQVSDDEAEKVMEAIASGELDAKSLAPIVRKWLSK